MDRPVRLLTEEDWKLVSTLVAGSKFRDSDFQLLAQAVKELQAQVQEQAQCCYDRPGHVGGCDRGGGS